MRLFLAQKAKASPVHVVPHKSCPLNKLKPKQSVSLESMHLLHSVEQDEALDDSDFEGFYSDDSLLASSDEEELSSDEDFAASPAIFCDCGRAHKRDCPWNPCNLKRQNTVKVTSGKGKLPLNGKSKRDASTSSSTKRQLIPLGYPSSKRMRVVFRKNEKNTVKQLFKRGARKYNSPRRRKSVAKSPLPTPPSHYAGRKASASKRLYDDHDRASSEVHTPPAEMNRTQTVAIQGTNIIMYNLG